MRPMAVSGSTVSVSRGLIRVSSQAHASSKLARAANPRMRGRDGSWGVVAGGVMVLSYRGGTGKEFANIDFFVVYAWIQLSREGTEHESSDRSSKPVVLWKSHFCRHSIGSPDRAFASGPCGGQYPGAGGGQHEGQPGRSRQTL